MAAWLAVLLAALGPAGGAHAMGAGTAPTDDASYVPGEVIVQFRADVGAEARDALLARLAMRVARPLGGQNAFLVALADGGSVPQAVERLRAQPEVISAAPNYRTRLSPVERPQPLRAGSPHPN